MKRAFSQSLEGVTRRQVLFSLLPETGGCRSQERAPTPAAGAGGAPPEPWPLAVKNVSSLGAGERGGTCVGQQHGFGAAGNDLVPLARSLLRPRGAERTKGELERHGFAVSWQPFHGGHAIPRSVVSALGSFLFGA